MLDTGSITSYIIFFLVSFFSFFRNPGFSYIMKHENRESCSNILERTYLVFPAESILGDSKEIQFSQNYYHNFSKTSRLTSMFWIDYPFQIPNPNLKRLSLDKLIQYCILVGSVAILLNFAPDFVQNNAQKWAAQSTVLTGCRDTTYYSIVLRRWCSIICVYTVCWSCKRFWHLFWASWFF